MTPDVAQIYADQSRRFILQAHYELEKKGDRYQASEKASNAVAQAVKAIAADRGWRHDSHRLRREIIDLLAAEFQRPELRALQNVADRLHDNNYEGSLHNWQVAADLADVTGWLESLVEVRALGANVDFEPSEEQSRAINRLRLSEAEAAAIPMIDWPPPMPPFDPEAE